MKLYFKYLKMQLMSQLEYKSTFFSIILSQIIMSYSGIFIIDVLYSRFGDVANFTKEDSMICYSVILFSFSLAETFFRGFDSFPRLISNGEFDRILVRPRNSIFQVVASNTEFTRLGRLIFSLIVLINVISKNYILWSFDKIVIYVLMIISGMVVYSGLFMLYATISFFTLSGLEFFNILTDGTRNFGMFPFSIYGKEILNFFTYIVPIALFQYYPFLYLAGYTNNKLYILLPLLGMLFIIPCIMLWKFGVKKYQSTGS